MKRIKIVELFAGYGSQALALKRLGYKIDEESDIVEWGVAPAIAYDILNPSNTKGKISNEELGSLLQNQSISNDTKKPAMSIHKTKIEALKKAIYQSGNYCDVKTYNIHKRFDLLTYSFPCQDISNQGSRQGFEKGSGTRSGLLWEVERMLENTRYKPKYLLMENVKALVGKKNMGNFQKWVNALERLGYKSEWKILNSAHFGIGQNRERVFMLSVREDMLTTELEDFKNIKGTDYKTPFKKHTMSLEEIEQSPWPINEKDLYLNEFELLPGQSGNYKLGNHIPSLDDIVEVFKPKYTSGEKGLANYGANIHKKIYRKMVQCHQVADEKNPQYTLPAGRPMGQEESNKVFSKFKSNTIIGSEENSARTLDTRMTGFDQQQIKVYQSIQANNGIVRFVRPLEKARIMGLTDDEFWKLYNNPALSSNQIESMFGNSIVVDVLEEIFKVLKIQGE